MMEFDREFPDDAACLEWLKNRLYPDGIFCPKCQKITKHHRVTKRPSYSCQFCGHHEHPMRGTIFQDSATSLKLWFHAIFLMASTRCGISAKQIERELGVTYKCAWRMFNRIRSMLNEDERTQNCLAKSKRTKAISAGKRKTNIGASGRSSNKGPVGKTAVWGAVEREGRVVARVLPDTTARTILPHVRERIMPPELIFTDEARIYRKLPSLGYVHQRVYHTAGIYVEGDAHTNTIEGFWSLTKNGIRGVYHNVSTKHLQIVFERIRFPIQSAKESRQAQYVRCVYKIASEKPFSVSSLW